MRFPVISVLVVGGLMIWASVYYFDINRGFNSVEVFPEDSHTRAGFEVLEEKFSFGYVNPTKIVIDGDMNDPQVQAAIAQLGEIIQADPELGTFIQQASASGDLGLLLAPVPGAPSGSAAFGVVERLRDDYIPAAFSGVPATVVVGGVSAEFLDFNGVVDTYTPISFGLILGVSFILLLIVFRSLVIPIKAIIMKPSLRRRRLRADGAGLSEGRRRRPVWVPADRDHRRVDTSGALRCSSSDCQWTITSSCSAASASGTTRR